MNTKITFRTAAVTGAMAVAALLQMACSEYSTADRGYYSSGYPTYAQQQQTYYAAPQAQYAAPAPIQVVAYQRLNEAQVDQLTAPIALYPDPLLAIVLPAATYPNDVAAAQSWLQQHPQTTEDEIAALPWDDSIKAVMHYPSVLQMMSDRLDWTQALDAAFINQQPDVMASIQRLRAQAQAAGSLQSTTQQDVIVQDQYVRIMPAQPEVIYVPVYDPQVVYVAPSGYWVNRPVITFGFGFTIGSWLDNDCDWRDRHVLVRSDWTRNVRRDNRNWSDGHGGVRVVNNNNKTVNNTRITNNNTTIINNNTTVNNTTVLGTGAAGSTWSRNTAKPQPGMPVNVQRQLVVQPSKNTSGRLEAPAPIRSEPRRAEPVRNEQPARAAAPTAAPVQQPQQVKALAPQNVTPHQATPTAPVAQPPAAPAPKQVAPPYPKQIKRNDAPIARPAAPVVAPAPVAPAPKAVEPAPVAPRPVQPMPRVEPKELPKAAPIAPPKAAPARETVAPAAPVKPAATPTRDYPKGAVRNPNVDQPKAKDVVKESPKAAPAAPVDQDSPRANPRNPNADQSVNDSPRDSGKDSQKDSPRDNGNGNGKGKDKSDEKNK